MTSKVFDCVAMKHEGARHVQALVAGMTVEQRRSFWRDATRDLLAQQAAGDDSNSARQRLRSILADGEDRAVRRRRLARE